MSYCHIIGLYKIDNAPYCRFFDFKLTIYPSGTEFENNWINQLFN